MMMVRTLCWLAVTVFLTACSSIQYTVDDGRDIDEAMLANIRALGNGEQAIRPAIVRAATLKPAGCDTQWELPFSVASSDGLEANDRIAWLRTLGMDERLTVIASTPESELALGDKIIEVEGSHSNSGEKMNRALMELRDDGKPFQVKTAEGRQALVTPLQVCRGHVRIALPSKPDEQDYRWTYSTHPLEVFREPLTQDEALWMVLWTQGLSEEGGARMKVYQYGKIVATVAAVVIGVGALSKATQSSGAAVIKGGEAHHAAHAVAAQSAGSAAAGEVGFIVAKNIAANQAINIAQQRAANILVASSKNRASLEGVSWVAGTVFEKADKWSFERMQELGADPLAAITLHQKLANAGSAANAFALDAERVSSLQTVAKSAQLDTKMARILNGPEQGIDGQQPDRIVFQLEADATLGPANENISLPDDAFDMHALAQETIIPVQMVR